MADDTNTTFTLDLDASGLISGANDAASAIKQVGSSSNLSGLIDGLAAVTPLVGIAAVAFFALKEILDTVFNAENIKSINYQFDLFTQNAGVSSEKLKQGLLDASHGGASTTEILQSANKALVELEVGAEKLPEIMDLARKATAVFGGTLTSNFESMAQAVASGNTRLLKHLGIVIDQQKAYRDYAVSIGTTVGSLSEAGKQQAILNAVLEKGSSAYKGLNTDLKQNTDIWQQVKIGVKEFAEGIALAFDKIAGPNVRMTLLVVSDTIRGWGNSLKSEFGEGAEKAAANIEVLKAKIQDIDKDIWADEERRREDGFFYDKETNDGDLRRLNKIRDEASKQLDDLNQKKLISDQLANQAATKAAASSVSSKPSSIDRTKQLQEEADFQKQLSAMKSKETEVEIKDMTTVAQAEELYNRKKLAEENIISAQIEEIKAKQARGDITDDHADAQIATLQHIRTIEAEKDEQALSKMRTQALEQYQEKSTDVFEGISRSFASMSQRNKADLGNFDKTGDVVSNAFSKNMVGAFKAIGDGSKSATQALGDAFKGMIGDIASKQGETMMLASVFPPNPGVFAAGAALVALGSALGASGSSSSSSASAPSSSDSSGVDTSGGGTSTALSSAATTTPKTATNIVIQGHLFNNDQTARWMTNMVRQSADATDFTIQSVNGGF